MKKNITQLLALCAVIAVPSMMYAKLDEDGRVSERIAVNIDAYRNGKAHDRLLELSAQVEELDDQIDGFVSTYGCGHEGLEAAQEEVDRLYDERVAAAEQAINMFDSLSDDQKIEMIMMHACDDGYDGN